MEPVQTKFFEDIELNWYERFLVNVSAAVSRCGFRAELKFEKVIRMILIITFISSPS